MNEEETEELKTELDSLGFSSYEGFNSKLICWRYRTFAPYFYGDTCLELGSSDGQGTEFLLQHFPSVIAVDGSTIAVESLAQRLSNDRLTALCSPFETLDLGTTFDTVVLAHVLEHVADPKDVLMTCKRHMSAESRLIIDVPNAMSIHRQVGVEMGLLMSVTDLNPPDLSIGHRRVYTPESLKLEIRRSELDILSFGGLFLKVLSNDQTEQVFSEEQQLAFLEVGKRYPDIASEIYAIARLARPGFRSSVT